MEVLNTSETNITSLFNYNTTNDSFEVSSNWSTVTSTKKLEDVISCGLAANCPSRITLEDIVDDKRCLEIKPNVDDNTGCLVTIKMKNSQKIVRIGIVSEASVLEIFRDFGEYSTTIWADFIDEYEGASVYYAEITLDRPSTETSVKFTRIKNDRTTMFLYGIRIIVEEITTENIPNPFLDFNLIKDMLKMTMGGRDKKQKNDESRQSHHTDKITNGILENPLVTQHIKFINNNNKKQDEAKMCIKNENPLRNNSNSDLETFKATIDTQLQEMETRIINKIDLVEVSMNKKLNDIIKLLETMKNNSS